MSNLLLHRRNRLDGIWALIDLMAKRRQPDKSRPSLPTAPRLRRDVGLPEIEPKPPIQAFSGRNL